MATPVARKAVFLPRAAAGGLLCGAGPEGLTTENYINRPGSTLSLLLSPH